MGHGEELDARLRAVFKSAVCSIDDQSAADQVYAASEIDGFADESRPRGHGIAHDRLFSKQSSARSGRPAVRVATIAVVLCAVAASALMAFSYLEGRQETLVFGDEVSSSSGVTATRTGSDAMQQWYDAGLFYGFWRGNVDTIPQRPASLPDFFFTHPTPTRAPSRYLLDPATVGKPLWVFGDDISVADFQPQIRQAMQEKRPILFYGTAVDDALDVLGLACPIEGDVPLDRLIIRWPSLTAGEGCVDTTTFEPMQPHTATVFGNMVYATLGGVDEVETTATYRSGNST